MNFVGCAGFQFLTIAGKVAVAGMRQDPLENGAVGQRLGYRHQRGIIGLETGTMSVAIDFKQHTNSGVVSAAEFTDRHRTSEIVENDLDVGTAAVEKRDARQLLRSDAHGINDVRDALFIEHVLGFLDSRDRDAAEHALNLHGGNRRALMRLDVRAPVDAELVSAPLTIINVFEKFGLVDQKARCVEFAQLQTDRHVSSPD